MSVLAHRFKNWIGRSALVQLASPPVWTVGAVTGPGVHLQQKELELLQLHRLHQNQLGCNISSTRPSNCSSDILGELSV